MNRPLAALAALALLSPIRAQDTKPSGLQLLMPADSTLVMHAKGPVALLKIHAADAAGQWMASPVIKEVWATVCKELKPLLENAGKELPDYSPITAEQVEALPELLAGFDGSLTLGVWLDPDADIDNFAPHHGCCILQVDPGGGDLRPLYQSICEAFDKEVDDPREIEVGSISTSVFSKPTTHGDYEVTRPFWFHGQLCVCVGGDIESFLERALRDSEENVVLARLMKDSSYYAHFDFANVDRIYKTLVAADEEENAWLASLGSMIGVSSLQRLSLRTSSEEEHYLTDVTVRWHSEPKGLAAAFLPERGRPSSLQRYVPLQLEESLLLRVDIPRLVGEVLEFAEKVSPGRELTAQFARESFQEQTGLRLFEDVLDHLGPHYMMVTSTVMPEEGDEEEEVELSERAEKARMKFEDTCHVLSLHNSAAFARSLEQMIRKMALHTGRKKNKYREHLVYTIRNPLLGLNLHYAVTPECVLNGFGKGGLVALHAVLDEIDEARQGKEQSLPNALAKRCKLVPEDYYSLAHVNMKEVVAVARQGIAIMEELGEEGWEAVLPERMDDERFRAVMVRVLPMIAKLTMALDSRKATYVLRVMRYENRSLTFREIW